MNKVIGFTICVLGWFYYPAVGLVPPVAKCNAVDSECLKTSAQAFLPIIAGGTSELKSLNPVIIKYVDSSSPNLNLKAYDISVSGLKNCIIKNISRDVAKSKLKLSILCTVEVEGEYSLKGKLLVLPINGQGHLVVSLKKILLNVDANMLEIDQDGKKHWNVNGWDFNYILKEKANVQLSNLFNGNIELNNSIRDLLGAISNELVMEVGSPIIKAIISEVVDHVNQFFQLVPVEDLTLD